MKPLSDQAVARLRSGGDEPDLTGTRYRLLERVARGGMGVVYAAEDEKLARRVALKVLDLPGANSDLANRLIREARVLARLEHPGIVPVHDVGTLADGRVFYTMKFVEGQRLDKFLETVASTQDRLRLFLRICDAVAFAHARGVLHRDLKPANVMVGSFGEVLVLDWGLAKILREPPALPEILADPDATAISAPNSCSNRNDSTTTSVITGHGTVMGTPGYMSPEQARGEVGSLDARSDIFSLGALLRFVLTQPAAFAPAAFAPAAFAPAALAPAARLDRSLTAICAKASAENRESRYANVQDLSLDVSRYLDGLAVSACPESIWDKTRRFYRRYRFFILLILAYLVMRILLLLILQR